MRRREGGFSIVEIAIVLVIIGLLLGGILKGQEMINSAKVRSLADMGADISAAYFGFVDRFRRVPGDWNNLAAGQAIGVAVTGGGNDNGRIDNPPGGPDTFKEPNALWEQLAKAGFLQGAYGGLPTTPDTQGLLTPLNAFNNVVVLGRTADYLDRTPAPAIRLNLVMGRGTPVNIARELDIKLDDGAPETGIVRMGLSASGNPTFGPLAESDPGCVEAGEYDVAKKVQDCTPVYLY